MDHPALPFLRRNEKGKVVSAADAVKLIRDGDTLATGGFVGIGFAEEIAIAIEKRFLSFGDDEDFNAWPSARSNACICSGSGRRQGAGVEPSRARRTCT